MKQAQWKKLHHPAVSETTSYQCIHRIYTGFFFSLVEFSYFVESECECPLMRTEQQITHYQSAEIKTNGPCRESRLLYRKRMILWIDRVDVYNKKHVDAE